MKSASILLGASLFILASCAQPNFVPAHDGLPAMHSAALTLHPHDLGMLGGPPNSDESKWTKQICPNTGPCTVEIIIKQKFFYCEVEKLVDIVYVGYAGQPIEWRIMPNSTFKFRNNGIELDPRDTPATDFDYKSTSDTTTVFVAKGITPKKRVRYTVFSAYKTIGFPCRDWDPIIANQ